MATNRVREKLKRERKKLLLGTIRIRTLFLVFMKLCIMHKSLPRRTRHINSHPYKNLLCSPRSGNDMKHTFGNKFVWTVKRSGKKSFMWPQRVSWMWSPNNNKINHVKTDGKTSQWMKNVSKQHKWEINIRNSDISFEVYDIKKLTNCCIERFLTRVI